MFIVLRICELLVAVVLTTSVFRRRPAHLPFTLMMFGAFRFGADAGIGFDFSALWLAWLILLLVLGIMRLQCCGTSMPEVVVLLVLAGVLLQGARSSDLLYAERAFLKLAYPLLCFVLASRAMQTEPCLDINRPLKTMLVISCIALLLAGGFAQSVVPGVWVWSCRLFGFWGSGGMANHLAIAGVIAFVMWRYTTDLRFLLLSLAAGVSPILADVRTGLGAYTLGIGAVLAVGFPKKVSVPVISLLFIGGICSILFVPTLRNHMFYGSDAIDPVEVLTNPQSMSWNEVNTSGRLDVWAYALDTLWYPEPLWGSGLGATQNLMYTEIPNGLTMVHSDYVEILCDHGIIGLSLFAALSLATMWFACISFVRYRNSVIGLAALLTLGCAVAQLFCMGFTPSIHSSPASMQYPFFFAGVLWGLVRRRYMVPGCSMLRLATGNATSRVEAV